MINRLPLVSYYGFFSYVVTARGRPYMEPTFYIIRYKRLNQSSSSIVVNLLGLRALFCRYLMTALCSILSLSDKSILTSEFCNVNDIICDTVKTYKQTICQNGEARGSSLINLAINVHFI